MSVYDHPFPSANNAYPNLDNPGDLINPIILFIFSSSDCVLFILQGSVAYVSQQAWIQNATVRENILFSRAFDSARYERVIDTCALRQDLEILPAGDATEIGERVRNINISWCYLF